jgi:predicted enzyme related to lactoylglutathione lyase
MSEAAKPEIGSLFHFDLAVPNAEEIRDFYSAVIGWDSEPLSMGDYDDYVMKTPDGKWVSGICHQRGENADWPSGWLVYIAVVDLDRSLATCLERGGRQLSAIRGEAGGDRFVVIQDPAGAYLALSQSARTES